MQPSSHPSQSPAKHQQFPGPANDIYRIVPLRKVNLPPNAADKIRYPPATVEKIRSLTMQYGDDKKTVDILNEQGILSATSKRFTRDMIQWIRFKHKIKIPILKSDDEFTVGDLQAMFNISNHMVYYWINNKCVKARKTPANKLLIKITPEDRTRLMERINNSYKTKYMSHPNCTLD